MPVLFKYLAPDGREIVIKGWTLEELIYRGKLPAIPHYKPIEREIAWAFITRERIPGIYYFDFRLPEEMPPEIAYMPLWVQHMWRALSDYRADIIIDTPDYWLVCEIKDLLSSTALSQPLLYKYLFKQYCKPKKPVRAALIVGEAKRRALEFAIAEGIEIFVTGVPSLRRRAIGL